MGETHDAPPTQVWVANLDLTEGAGYISAHRSETGAVAKVREFAAALGIDAHDFAADAGSQVLDDDPGVASYGVYSVPLED